MIPAKELELVVLNVNDKIDAALSKGEGKQSLKKTVTKYIETDEYFYNFFSSAVVAFSHNKKQSFMNAGIQLMKSLDSCTDLYDILTIMKDRITIATSALDKIKDTNPSLDGDLEVFIKDKVLPYNWSKDYGVCINISFRNRTHSELARAAYALSSPFITFHYPIQDNTKQLVIGESTYVDRSQDKYTGDNLKLRIEFAKYIIELHKHYNNK